MTLEDIINQNRGLTMPELGASAGFGQPREISLGAQTDLSPGASMDPQLAASLGQAVPAAVGQLASGVMQAQMIGEKQKRKALSEGVTEVAKGMSQAQSQATEAQINPLRSLIANYRAAIG